MQDFAVDSVLGSAVDSFYNGADRPIDTNTEAARIAEDVVTSTRAYIGSFDPVAGAQIAKVGPAVDGFFGAARV